MSRLCIVKHFYVEPSARGNGLMFRFNESTHGGGRSELFLRSFKDLENLQSFNFEPLAKELEY